MDVAKAQFLFYVIVLVQKCNWLGFNSLAICSKDLQYVQWTISHAYFLMIDNYACYVNKNKKSEKVLAFRMNKFYKENCQRIHPNK